MTQTGGLKIKRLSFIGPAREPAAVDFSERLTVICGASDTGKSFVVESIDFVLGSSKPLRDLPQRVGYDRVRLQLLLGDESLATVERSIEGGNFRLVAHAVPDDEQLKDAKTLRAQHRHGQVDNLSGWLLTQIGLNERRIKRNKAGATNSLSFRNVVDFVIVNELDIIKERSCFQTGQYVTATSEYATLKLLLTGMDDSSLAEVKKDQVEDEASDAKLEFIGSLISDLEAELADTQGDERDLIQQHTRLSSTIEMVQAELERARSGVDETMSRRREAVLDKNRKEERANEINDLLVRFDLLSTHYESDIRRLEAIQESGTLFVQLDNGPCPLCGTPPSEQHHTKDCDGDIASIVESAESEIQKIRTLQSELSNTYTDLKTERATLIRQIGRLNSEIGRLNEHVESLLAPALTQTQVSFRELADRSSNVTQDLDRYQRLARLKVQRDQLIAEYEPTSENQDTSIDLSKSVLDEFALKVQRILQDWHFPSADRVYFDEKTRDLVINGKPRGSYGKGFRAITLAAVTIGLMEFCLTHELPHPGFVVMDSPLLAYWAPEGINDSLEGTDLKEQFYKYLSSKKFVGQVIIVDNEHPPQKLLKSLTTIIFTRNPSDGRFGLFPTKT